jgi:uncharacterized protein
MTSLRSARFFGRIGLSAHAGVLAVGALLFTAIASAQIAVPALRSPVTDLTNTLSQSQVASLDNTLREFAERSGSQVAVLMVPTIEPEPIEDFSMRVAEAWKLGREDQDDGVLFIIAKNDRNMRIEVGYGLEGALPDVTAKRIVRDTVAPRFRSGEFYLGIVAGVDSITRSISGESLPAPTVAERARRPGTNFGSLFGFFVFLAFVAGSALRRIFGRFLGATLTGGIVAFVVWLVVGMLAVVVIAAIVSFLITLLGGGMGSNRRNRFGGFGGSGWGSGGWGGSSGGFGGWSGGGGGFGGGGASGRW